MSDWSSQPDEGGEGEAMRTADKFAALGFVIMFIFALFMLIVQLADITIPLS